MQDLRVALVQADQIWENKEANLNNYSRLIQGVEADLFVLPEMFSTGFTMKCVEYSEKMDDSRSLQWLIENSRSKNAAFYTSLIIEENGKYYNRAVFVKPDGHITTYDKRKAFGLANEDKYYTPGSEEVIVDYKNWKIQLQVCYDLRFPELVRNRMEGNNAAYDAVLYVANWPEKRASHWNALLKARAIENQCYVIGVNRVGNDGNGHKYSGDSKIVDALGVENCAQIMKEECFIGVINACILKETRDLLPFLKDR